MNETINESFEQSFVTQSIKQADGRDLLVTGKTLVPDRTHTSNGKVVLAD